MLYVEKRDGSKQLFDKNKISTAVIKAFNAVDGLCTEEALIEAGKIAQSIYDLNEDLSVEQIQDKVEEALMDVRKDVARAYITYRNERTRQRERNSNIRKIIKEKLSASNVQNQNANVDEASFGGRIGEADNALMKELALNEYMSKRFADNHRNNIVYIHDLDRYVVGMHNCMSVPFDMLFENGFALKGNTRKDIRPPQTVSTAFQLVAVIFQIQSLEEFGGVSATHLDWTMVPFVRKSFNKHFRDGLKYIENREDLIDNYKNPLNRDIKDISIEDELYKEYQKAYKYAKDMTEREVHQSAEAMYHNLNTLQSRSGCQLPFSSINYGTCTLPEGRMISIALLEESIKGIGEVHRTPIFPCCIYKLKKGINEHPGDPNYDIFKLAVKCTAKRLYPNYANVDWSGNAGYDPNDPKTEFSTMGCRTANGFDINADPGVNPQTKDGRGNICPCTVIMPTIAMMAKEESIKNNSDIVEEFMKLLDFYIHEAKDELIERFEWIASQPADSAKFMYGNKVMLGYDGKDIRSALKHGTLALGQIGLAETLQILIGCDHTEEKGMELAKRIEQLFKDRCAEFKQQYKLNFGVYFTPKFSWVA